jgi:hypothetical protein
MKEKDILTRINEAMESVDNIGRAMPAPFFYTRLEARLNRRSISIWEQVSVLVTRPTVALVTLSLVLIMNAFVVVQGVSAIADQPDLNEMAVTEDLRSSNYYDIENVQP